MINERLVLRFRGLPRSDARELAEAVGEEATIIQEESGPVGGYGDVGTKAVEVTVTARALRALARYLAGRQDSHDEAVRLVVQIDDPDGTRREETLAYKAAPGQSTVEAAASALRALPGVGEALERSLW
jgi:alkylation response protein AidB-like acyl-CoA dehydrogenase